MMNDDGSVDAATMQVVIRRNEYCERCGARNPFVKRSVIRDGDGTMCYAKCKFCGASVKIFVMDPD